MYRIQKNIYGFKLVFSGFINETEMKAWLDESVKLLATAPKDFGVFVDMRDLKPLPIEAQRHMEEGQKLYKAKGMKRSVVILASPITTMQFRRIAKQTGIDQWERYIDASTSPNWEKLGIDWLQKAVEPDQQNAAEGAQLAHSS